MRRLASNAAVPMLAGLLQKALDMGFALFYFRVLGDEAAGAFKFLVVLVTYLDTLVNFGLNTIVARDVARRPELAAAAFRAAALLRIGLWLLGLPVVAITLGPARETANLPPAAALAGALFYLGLLPSVLASTATALFWARERLEVPAGIGVLTTLVKIGLGVLALWAGMGLVGLGATSLAANVFAAAALLAALRLCAWPRLASVASATPGSRLLAESWPLFVNQLLAGLFFKVDALLLPALAGLRAAGAYGVAYTVIDGVGVISSSFTLALFPRLAREAERAGAGLARAYRMGLRLLLQVAFPLAVGIALLAEPLVSLIGGRSYLPEGALALSVLIFFLPFSFANGLTQYVLIALGHQRFLTAAFVAALVFNLAANALLIPRLGILGAALVTVASEVVLLVPFHWKLRQAIPSVSLLREGWHAMVAALLMAPVVWWLRDGINPVAAIVAGLLVYPTALWAVCGVDEDQVDLLRRLLPSFASRWLRAVPQPPTPNPQPPLS